MKLIYPILLSVSCLLATLTATAQEHPSSSATETTAKNLVDRGNEKFDRGDFNGAIADYKLALKAKPDYARAYYDLGLASCWLGNPKAEISYFTQAIKYNPSDADSYTERGIARVDSTDIKGAMTDFKQALNLNPKQARAYWGRGRARQYLNNPPGEVSDFTRAIQLDPGFSDAYYRRGAAYTELAAFHQNARVDYEQKAIADYTQAIKLEPNFALAYNNRGFSYDNLGNKKAAIADIQKASQLYFQKKMMTNYQEEIQQLALVKKN